MPYIVHGRAVYITQFQSDLLTTYVRGFGRLYVLFIMFATAFASAFDTGRELAKSAPLARGGRSAGQLGQGIAGGLDLAFYRVSVRRTASRQSSEVTP